jgi:hypothetical protein
MINWIKKLLGITPTQKYFWKEVKCEYLRQEIDYGTCPQDINYIYVYAITQICADTGARRMVERHSWIELKEYDNINLNEQ